MSANDIGNLRNRLKASRTKLLAEVEGIHGWQADWRPDQAHWSVRQTLAHLGSAERSHLQVVYSIMSGTVVDTAGFDLDTWNCAEVAKRDGWSLDQTLADLREAHKETLDLLDRLDAEMLNRAGFHPALGEVSVGQVLRVIALHDNMHRRDIARLRDKMQSGHSDSR